MKIEPMSVENLKANLPLLFELASRDRDKLTAATAWAALEIGLAWAHERARGNQSSFSLEYHLDDSYALEADERHLRTKVDWLNEVLDEIGWPKEGR